MKKWNVRLVAWTMLIVLAILSVGMSQGGETLQVQAYKSSMTMYGYTHIRDEEQNGFKIQIFENSEGEIRKYLASYTGTEVDVVLPPVHEISASLFAYNKQLRSVVIPNTVEEIEDCAFLSCENLQSITFEEGNENADLKLYSQSVSKCNSLKQIRFPKKREIYLDSCSMSDCTSLEEIHFTRTKNLVIQFNSLHYEPSLVNLDFGQYERLEICFGAVGNCNALKKVVFPECLNPEDPDNGLILWQHAFSKCDNLKEVTFPVKVLKFVEGAFDIEGINYHIPAGSGALTVTQATTIPTLTPVPTLKPTMTPEPTLLPQATEQPEKTADTPMQTEQPEKTADAPMKTEQPEKTADAPIKTEQPEETADVTDSPSETTQPDEEKKQTDVLLENEYPSNSPEPTQIPEGTKYHFRYNTQGGILSSTFDSDTVRYGDVFSDLETASRQGYAFDGWYTEPEGGTKIENGTECDSVIAVLYAHWTPLCYNVKFDGNFGTVDTETKTVTYGQPYGSLPVAKKDGSVFKGWYTKTNLGQLVTSEDIFYGEEDICLYAVWEDEYDVEFNAKGGKVSFIRKLVRLGKEYGTLPSVVKNGYVFEGWYTDSIGGMRITEDTVSYAPGKQVLYAHWSKEGTEQKETQLSATKEPEMTKVPTPTAAAVPTPKTEATLPGKETPAVTKTAEPAKKSSVGTVTLLSVKNIKTGSIKLTWKKVKSAKGYIIQISTNKKFTKNVTKKKTSGQAYVIKRLQQGKTYYIRVRAYHTSKNKTSYGSYSKIKKIKIK